MAVYKRGYQRYTGPYTSHSARVLAFPRFAWKRIMGQRLVIIVMMAALFWPLACAAFVYLSNHTRLFQSFEPWLLQWLKIDGRFFLIFMDVQTVAAVVLAALAGPGLVAPDLADNALPLYFSRPLSRLDYVLARLLVLCGLLSLVTWVPGMLLFGMQSSMAGRTWFWSNWKLCAGMLAGFGILILLISLVALASSAWVRWRAIAGALVLAFFFVLAGAAGIIYAVLESEWGALLNPASTLHRVWCYLLDVQPPTGPSPFASAAALGLMCGLLCWVLERKLRPVEVVA